MTARARNLAVDGQAATVVPAELAAKLARFLDHDVPPRMGAGWWAPPWLEQVTSTLRTCRLAEVEAPAVTLVDAADVRARTSLSGGALELMSTADVAELGDVDRRTVTRWCRSGDLAAEQVGGEWLVRRVDAETFIEKRHT